MVKRVAMIAKIHRVVVHFTSKAGLDLSAVQYLTLHQAMVAYGKPTPKGRYSTVQLNTALKRDKIAFIGDNVQVFPA